MATWGTSRPLYARFEVGQNSRDLLAKFEVGQNFRDLEAALVVRASASIDLSAKTRVYHLASAEAYAHFIIRQPASAEFYGLVEIRSIDSEELYASVVIQDTAELYGHGTIRNVASVNLPATVEVGQDSADLYAHAEIQAIINLYAHAVIRQSASADLSATFEVGQGSQDLLARFEVGQGEEDLLGVFELVNIASQDLLVKVVIMHSAELYGKLIVTRRGDVQDLPAFFSVGQNSEDLWSSMIIRHPVQLNLYGALIVRHTGTPIELYGHAIIRHPDSAETYAHLVAKNIGSAELFCSFTTQSIADLYAKLVVGPPTYSDAYMVCNNPASWINVVMGLGDGFIAMPWVEPDYVVKACGNSSARLTSNYAPRSYKEIRFGWNGVCLGSPARLSGYDGILRSRVDFRREIPKQAFKELSAKFYIMANLLDFDNWRDLGLPGAWWQENASGYYNQVNAESDHIEVVVANPESDENNIGEIWQAIGTLKKYQGGTFTFNLQFQDPWNATLPGSSPVAGLTFSRYLDAGSSSPPGDNGVYIYYHPPSGEWRIYCINGEGVKSAELDISIHADFENRHTYKIIWETPSQNPPNGRVMLYIDDLQVAVITAGVPYDLLSFAVGVQAHWLGPNTRCGCLLYAYSDAE